MLAMRNDTLCSGTRLADYCDLISYGTDQQEATASLARQHALTPYYLKVLQKFQNNLTFFLWVSISVRPSLWSGG
jgi:hypothetical protein